YAADDVAGFERETYVGHLDRKFLSQPFLQFFHWDSHSRLQLNLDHAFLRATVPQVNQVNGIARRMDAHKAKRDLDVRGADLPLDDIKRGQRDSFGAADLRACGRAQPQLQLTGLHRRKNFRAELATDEKYYETRHHEVNAGHQPASANEAGEQLRVPR